MADRWRRSSHQQTDSLILVAVLSDRALPLGLPLRLSLAAAQPGWDTTFRATWDNAISLPWLVGLPSSHFILSVFNIAQSAAGDRCRNDTRQYKTSGVVGGGGNRPGGEPRSQRENSSPRRLLCSHWAQACEQVCLAEGFLQDGCDLPRCQRNRVAGGHDHADTLIMQPIDQAAGPLAPSESPRATSGACSEIRRSASTVVATGPATSAPQSGSKFFSATAASEPRIDLG